ncbi:Pentatricopeptide repeat-containing protein [Nymphaea thermarum]|nr:Pentatricopeptide repeat-containing protein [Nymphaea thermarum]
MPPFPPPPPPSWTTLIQDQAWDGDVFGAFGAFSQMRRFGVRPNHVVFATLLGICGRRRILSLGVSIHSLLLKSLPTLKPDVGISNSLVSMYCKCGRLPEALRIFQSIRDRDTVSWNAIISGCMTNDYIDEGWKFFKRMKSGSPSAVRIDSATLTTILASCSDHHHFPQLMMIHGVVIVNGFGGEVAVCNALLTGCFNCGKVEYAIQLFDEMSMRNVVSWTAAISGLAQENMAVESIELFRKMRGSSDGVQPNASTITASLMACSCLGHLKLGRQIHGVFLKIGLRIDAYVESSLVDMYAKCALVDDAWKVFETSEHKDTVSMTAMLVGFSLNGYEEAALQLFRQMMTEKTTEVQQDQTLISAVLGVCSSLSLGKQIHSTIIKTCLFKNVFVANSLISMYFDSGALEDAVKVFGEMGEGKNSVSWNTMIDGFANHGHFLRALQLYDEMRLNGHHPSDVTFLSLLHACSHGGLIDKGLQFFSSMIEEYKMKPRMEHYACVVDMLGRAGLLSKAKAIIHNMPMLPGAVIWQALLGACGIHGDEETARYAASRLMLLESEKSETYALLSNVYSMAGRWDEKLRVYGKMKRHGISKEAGLSWIEV